MKKTILALVGALALMLGGIASAASAIAAPAPTGGQLQIVRVGTDAMGTDTRFNLNREYVTFKNVTGGDLDIVGVLVEDNWAHSRTVAGESHTCNTYKITDLPGPGTNTVLGAGESVTVFNGSRWGGDRKVGSEYQLYARSDVDCGTAGHFYNNDADVAWVTLSNGTELAKKSWDWNGGYYVG
ncbi:hypothetical protein [Nonomuraea angiospora]|uniref:hypothetical protein n=1 Tax=Nonomuraea angiospora TaxID=46172 RepID=UPI0029A3434C|nr:hypothetical protein [Nonomuraea angiospora]MDX3109566.1 hypothetical protein [Nonomuraea angiospora]